MLFHNVLKIDIMCTCVIVTSQVPMLHLSCVEEISNAISNQVSIHLPLCCHNGISSVDGVQN